MFYLKNINELPGIEILKNNAIKLAKLEKVMESDWEYRYFLFDSKWDKDEMLATMSDKCGSQYFIVFSKEGVFGKIIDIETPYLKESSLKKLNSIIPQNFRKYLEEPAFYGMKYTSFIFWRSYSDLEYSIYPNNLENYSLLKLLKLNPNDYKEWADDYYEEDIDIELIKSVFL